MSAHNNKNTAIAGCGFHHLAIKVIDFDVSQTFYKDVLGFVPFRAWGDKGSRAVMLDTGDGSYVELFEGGPQEAKDTRLVHFALRADNCDAAIDRARKAGMTVTVEPKNVDIPANPVFPVRIGFFLGPNGETIEFFQTR